MKVSRDVWTRGSGWSAAAGGGAKAQLVLYFVGPSAVETAKPFETLRGRYPDAHIVGCSTGGEIVGEDVQDDSVVAVAVEFAHTPIKVAKVEVGGADQSEDAGRQLAAALGKDGLKAVYILADGMLTNGSSLINGVREVLGEAVTLTGGLAGDGADFKQTHVGCDGPPRSGLIAAVGFYGENVRIGFGSFGGWDRFGPERIITRSAANVLLELDGEPALDLYKRYLGDEAANLPGSALLFPLTVRPPHEKESEVVRTVVGVDDDKRSMIFAGDVPEGYVAQLMRGHFDGLIEGAGRAAAAAAGSNGATLALLVSCIGRKLLMGQRIVEEVEAASDSLGKGAVIAGFYSYGEIAPHGFTGRCELHNQTMTITAISEA